MSEGDRFERLVVLAEAGRTRAQKRTYSCLCDCGNVTVVVGSNLRNGATRSCGCLKRDLNRAELTIHGNAMTPAWFSWVGMKTRCTNPNAENYVRYGGRGITICARWTEPNGCGFANFLADMGERPDGLTLDRVDVNGNYEPSNCRWATALEQRANRR